MFDEWISGYFKSVPTVRRFHEVFRALNLLGLDPTLTWRLDYYLSMTNEYNLVPTIETFNFLWRALREFDPPHFGFISVLLNEMEQRNVQPDGTTVYEIITFCAKYPMGLFPETAFKYMKLYLIIMKDQKSNYWYDPQVLHSYLMVWVKARNYGEAVECKRWYVSMSIWNKELQQTLDGLELMECPPVNLVGVLTRELWDFHNDLWHRRALKHGRRLK